VTVHGKRSPTRAPTSAKASTRALSVVLFALQLLALTVGAAFAGQSHPHASARSIVTTTSSSADGAVRPASSDARLEGARPRGDRGDRGAPPVELAVLPVVARIGAASLTGSLDSGTTARDHRPPPSVVNGARGPPQT
jgi:hypothetical protein